MPTFYSYRQWNQAIQCLAVLDVLISMAQYSLGGEDIMCRPEFVEPSKNIKVLFKCFGFKT